MLVRKDLLTHPTGLLLRSTGKYIKAMPAETEQYSEHLFRLNRKEIYFLDLFLLIS